MSWRNLSLSSLSIKLTEPPNMPICVGQSQSPMKGFGFVVVVGVVVVVVVKSGSLDEAPLTISRFHHVGLLCLSVPFPLDAREKRPLPAQFPPGTCSQKRTGQQFDLSPSWLGKQPCGREGCHDSRTTCVGFGRWLWPDAQPPRDHLGLRRVLWGHRV